LLERLHGQSSPAALAALSLFADFAIVREQGPMEVCEKVCRHGLWRLLSRGN
jgi:hypothetical protein